MSLIHTRNFTYDKNLQKMYAEASELDGFWPRKTIELMSHRTNKSAHFTLKTIKFDASQEDIVAWEYVPVIPIAGLVRVVIFND